MFANRHIVRLALSVLLCLPFGQISAQQYQKKQLQHHLNLSVGAGIDVDLASSAFVRTGVGGDGQFAASYEVRDKGFFFNVGLGADYRVMNYGMNGMTHAYASQDRDGNPISYRYVYSGYSETQHTLYATLPIRLGYIIQDRVYISAGVKAALPIWNTYAVKATMYTEGVYTNLIDPVSQNVPSFAYYPKSSYSGSGTYTAPTLYVSPMVEAGVVFELTQKISCRLGAFAEYALPIGGKCPHTEIVNYAAIDMNPQTRSQQNLKSGLAFGSLLNGKMNDSATAHAGQNIVKDWSQFLSVGVRATFSFNVTKYKPVCKCLGLYY